MDTVRGAKTILEAASKGLLRAGSVPLNVTPFDGDVAAKSKGSMRHVRRQSIRQSSKLLEAKGQKMGVKRSVCNLCLKPMPIVPITVPVFSRAYKDGLIANKDDDYEMDEMVRRPLSR